jgi:flavin reductase (DIM6/NTAB) family NADH-FMN oxidoreductase RutF
MATYALRKAVNITSEEFEPSVDEFQRAGLEKAASRIVRPPRVAQSPVQFECAYMQTLRLPGNSEAGTVDVVFGRVLAIHIDDAALTNGRIDIARLRPLARLGYFEYTAVNQVFEMRPPTSGALAAGMEGSAQKFQRAETEGER